MSATTRAGRGERSGGLPPALLTDLPVLGLLVACWLLLPIGWAHLLTGVALAGLIAVHLRTRPHPVARLFRRDLRPVSARRVGRRLGYWLLLVTAAAMTVTGLLRWAGVAPQYVWHGGISYLLLTLVVVHLWSVRRPLRTRLCPAAAHRTRKSLSII
jgi:hypothetical protein